MRNEELIAVFQSEDYAFENDGPETRSVVISVRLLNGETMRCRGLAAERSFAKGLQYRLFGHYSNHPKYGRQFAFNSFVEETPLDPEAVVAYLSQCRGVDRGSISTRVAEALVDKYGVDAIQRLIENPVEAAEGIKLWDATKAAIAARILSGQRQTQRTKIDLIQLFDGYKFPKKTVDSAIRRFGASAGAEIRANPFLLCQFRGIGFKLADQLYCALARERCAEDSEQLAAAMAGMFRQIHALCDAVNSETRTSGSTWHSVNHMAGRLNGLIGPRANAQAAIAAAQSEGLLRLSTCGRYVALESCAAHETDIAVAVGSAKLSGALEWPEVGAVYRQAPPGKPLSGHQVAAIGIAMSQRYGCLQGSPGVGKTFSVACIVKAIMAEHGEDSVGVAAPTGKAAVRMTQSLVANGVMLQACTIHRMLQVKAGGEGGGWSFVYNEKNPLPYRFLVIDESSMIDTDLMAALLRACSVQCHILLVGDSNQLPPVGHGRPFLDLQEVLPTGRLTEIRRNSGLIVRCCASIRDENKFLSVPQMNLETGDNLILVQCADEAASATVESLLESAQRLTANVVDDVQVLCAKNDRRVALNQQLQTMLNPNRQTVKGNPFRVGDKVVCTKNGAYPDVHDKLVTHFVANGELGSVRSIQPGRMIILLQDPIREVIVTYSAASSEKPEGDGDQPRGAVGDWDLGYCLSGHRSQGSQWPYVIVLVDRAGAMVQSRNWVYTVISRAEKATLVVGTAATIQQSMRRDGLTGRVTLLVDEIRRISGARQKPDISEIFAGV